MILNVVNENLAAQSVIDVFTSFIWKDKYAGNGDFELLLGSTTAVINKLNAGTYLTLAESDRVMKIETVDLQSDATDGDKLIVKGPSVEIILSQRIVEVPLYANGNLQTVVQGILNTNVISPTDPDRTMNVVFEASTDPKITNLTIDKNYYGETIYDLLVALCEEKQIGFKMTNNGAGKFKFKLYAGTDRSVAIDAAPPVIFSIANGNLSSSSYLKSSEKEKTIVRIIGIGESGITVVTTKSATTGSKTGIHRKESFLNLANNGQQTNGAVTFQDGVMYIAQAVGRANKVVDALKTAGDGYLAENKLVETFTGEITPTGPFIFNTHYYMGDLVKVADAYGHSSTSRVVEYINSQDAEGPKHYPTFEAVPYNP